MNPFAIDDLPQIEAERVVLRALENSDAAALLEVFSDADALKYWGHGPLADFDAAHAYISSAQRAYQAGSRYQWAITLDGKLLGSCALSALNPQHLSATLSYVLATRCLGQGYAREAVHALVSVAFDALDLNRIEADTDPRHIRSIRLLEALGFQREGLLRQRYRIDGNYQDALMFGMLKEDWQV